jgi:hypothetical protein
VIQVIYRLRDGFRAKGDIRAIGERIEALKKRHATPENPEGSVSDEEVLEDARSPDSPLHGCFTWDESDAARLQNLHEARYLMRCYEVRIEKTDSAPIVISPANVRISAPEGRSRFVSPVVAMSNAETRAAVLREALSLVIGAQQRLRNFQELSPALIRAINEVRTLMEAELEPKPAPKARRRPARGVQATA